MRQRNDEITRQYIDEGLTMEQIGKHHHISRQRVEQILHTRRRRRLARERSVRQCVYFVRVADYIKIGIAVNFTRRLKALEACCPLPMTVLGVLPHGGRAFEAVLHKRFAASRYRYEWFHVTPELLMVVDELTRR